MPSWAQGSSVIRGGKEWLQPSDFLDYTYDQVDAVCPGGICSGVLPGSSFDLTGYTWASIMDVGELFNVYGIDPPFPEPFQDDLSRIVRDVIFNDFRQTGIYIFRLVDPILSALVRDPAPPGDLPYRAGVYFGEVVYTYTFEDPGGDYGVWFWREAPASRPAGLASLVVYDIGEPSRFDISGTAIDGSMNPACALVMASGRCVFSCGAGSLRCEGGTQDFDVGKFRLLDLPTEADDTIRLQVFIEGHVSYTKVFYPTDRYR
jgi:hypothetical protein